MKVKKLIRYLKKIKNYCDKFDCGKCICSETYNIDDCMFDIRNAKYPCNWEIPKRPNKLKG